MVAESDPASLRASHLYSPASCSCVPSMRNWPESVIWTYDKAFNYKKLQKHKLQYWLFSVLFSFKLNLEQ